MLGYYFSELACCPPPPLRSSTDSVDDESSIHLLQSNEFKNADIGGGGFGNEPSVEMMDQLDEGIEKSGSTSTTESSNMADSLEMMPDECILDDGSEESRIVRDFEKQHRTVLPLSIVQLSDILDARIGQSRNTEPALTKFIQDLADKCGGVVYGLNFRMKSSVRRQ